MSHFVSKTKKSIKVYLITASLIIILLLAWLYFLPKRLPDGISLTQGWMFIEPTPTGPAIGDLGGVQVTIPRHFVLFLEYDGDPHFMEKRQGPIPKRTPETKISGFAFEIRFPDMAGNTPENHAEKKASTIFNTMWMRVLVYSNSDFGREDFLDQIVTSASTDKLHGNTYRKIIDDTHGLSGLTPTKFDEEKRLSLNNPKIRISDPNIYYHLNQHGRVDTYIECSNRYIDSAPCEQHFNLLPAMRTRVSVHYRIGLLPLWRDIQAGVTKTILGFSNNHIQANQTTTEGNKQ